jgi:hypothetical protein
VIQEPLPCSRALCPWRAGRRVPPAWGGVLPAGELAERRGLGERSSIAFDQAGGTPAGAGGTPRPTRGRRNAAALPKLVRAKAVASRRWVEWKRTTRGNSFARWGGGLHDSRNSREPAPVVMRARYEKRRNLSRNSSGPAAQPSERLIEMGAIYPETSLHNSRNSRRTAGAATNVADEKRYNSSRNSCAPGFGARARVLGVCNSYPERASHNSVRPQSAHQRG